MKNLSDKILAKNKNKRESEYPIKLSNYEFGIF